LRKNERVNERAEKGRMWREALFLEFILSCLPKVSFDGKNTFLISFVSDRKVAGGKKVLDFGKCLFGKSLLIGRQEHFSTDDTVEKNNTSINL
jgi:hypothetical protein